MSREKFLQVIQQSYTTPLPSIFLGAGVLDGEILAGAKVNLPLRMMNRLRTLLPVLPDREKHALQLMAEQLSAAGTGVMPDMKGDLGMAKEGTANDKINDRAIAARHPGLLLRDFRLKLYSLSGKKGAQMRATVSRIRPVLLGKILELNEEPQSGVLAVVFKYTDDKNLPIVDLNDLKKVLNYLSEEPGHRRSKPTTEKYPVQHQAPFCGKSLRSNNKVWARFFGERSFDIRICSTKLMAVA